ncbi:hypothetical protein [Pseudomonas sp. 6D_7.1_Bac1]|uniref:hypothetical protein n=1 Tax=Pseudomonas sp. 6D_7.1_Bac1 TaxID=2971615 RepID=UPI0021C71D8D|nr:hypothetical protein [Pseudomonas sp. 6D_7.1_Bac1]MCU1748439.1 hypothetical protein [Pseudomonas sp. 6D_7.1_Bac1]
MKHRLRLFLVLLISFALPLSAMAGVAAPTEPCPMTSMGMAMMAGMDQGCCHDMDKASNHGNPCKPGQECKSGGILQVSMIKPATPRFSTLSISVSSDFLPARTLSGVWRPPRV